MLTGITPATGRGPSDGASLSRWGPRDIRSASATLSVLLVVSGAAMLVDSLSRFFILRQFDPWVAPMHLALIVLGGFVMPCFLFVLAQVVRLRRERSTVFHGVLGPLVALGVITALNMVSGDASAGSQFFVIFPLVYAAHHLRRGASAVVCAAALLSQATLSFALLPHDAAARAALAIGMVIVTVTWLVSTLDDRRERAIAALHRRASIDALTGLATRQVLETRADDLFEDPSVDPAQVALLLVDVDHFKVFNDTYGHPAGDAVLKAVAQRIERAVRPGDLVARMGGDELAVLSSAVDLGEARARGEELLRSVCFAPVLAGPHRLDLSISIGVATGTMSFSALYSAADLDLYRAKRGGRGRVSDHVRGIEMGVDAAAGIAAEGATPGEAGAFVVAPVRS